MGFLGRKFALQPEIQAYFMDVANKFDLRRHIQFRTVVESSQWDEESGSWLSTLRDLSSNTTSSLRSKILVSAVGGLSIPKKCDLPGTLTFEGKLFHSAQWDHSFNWKGKNIVVLGNGCSATQFVPAISDGPGAARKVTQFAKQAHWLGETLNPEYSAAFKWMMRWVPLAMRLYRLSIYLEKEKDFRGFDTVSGAAYRADAQKEAIEYIRKNAPAKYRDFLVPKTEIGCKRGVKDTEYLASLHRSNVELVYDDPVEAIIPSGVRTRSGRVISADAIILATGFETQQVLAPMEIYGENGISVKEHWGHVSDGSPSAYFGTCLSGFPNFFIMMGPNTLSGHLSVIYTTECQVNFMMRVIRPIKQCLAAEKPKKADILRVKPDAEIQDIAQTQLKARQLVWASGCSSWFLDPETGRNSVMFPDYQYKFWLKSIFVTWKDVMYQKSA
ncbi:hypothetical protein DL769_007578 [Monosporascus sp. CRB-8-3]|nr:hypothetical protein DL769_007578 [Monosporascus sp. CRB-8-3]